MSSMMIVFFFFNDTATTEIYTLSLHDALPIFEVLARRASSSAVWKATSSRWSTMYWATSFCERENSSKRAWMYSERDCGPASPGGGAVVVAVCFIGAAVFDARRRRSFQAAGEDGARRTQSARLLRGSRALRDGASPFGFRPVGARWRARGWGDMCAETAPAGV